MIELKCPQCGHEIEVGESMRGQAIHCARCGQVLVPKPAIDVARTMMGPAPLLTPPDEPDVADEIAVEDAEDTLSPKPTIRTNAFPFLAAAKGPGELGWLAHYRVIRLLGQGGMGIVFEAVDTHLQRPVALKVMKPELAQDDAARQRFVREARAMASVHSDHVITVHQVAQRNNVPYLAMEFLQGETLDKWLERRGTPTIAEVIRLGIEIAQGLAAAHERGLIHRDIKPGNIFLETAGGNAAGSRQQAAGSEYAAGSGQQAAGSTKNGSDHKDSLPAAGRLLPAAFRVKILDFGLARILQNAAPLTHSGLVMGTPAYMAPEQVEGKDVDARCDLFSLGCVLYLLTTGQQAFKGSSSLAILMAVASREPTPPQEFNPEIPPPLADLIMTLLAKAPANRPASAQVVVELLEAIRSDLGLSPHTPHAGHSLTRTMLRPRFTAPRRRWINGLIAAVLVALVGLVAWQIIMNQVSRPPEIVLGMSAPFTGPARELGREMRIGIHTYFQHVNENGGVAGRKLKLLYLDDGYEPNLALANMRELHEEKSVFAIIGNVGTPTAAVTVPYASQNKLLFFGAFTGAKLLREDPPDRYVFNYRASYEEETAKIVQYLVNHRGIRPDQIAVFAQDDDYGRDAYRGVVKVLQHDYRREPSAIVHVKYKRNTVDVQDAVQTIFKHPELHAVVMVGTYRPSTTFVQKVKDARPDMLFASVSFVGKEALAEALVDRGSQYADGIIVSQVVPPVDSGATLVLSYRAQLKKYHPIEKPSVTSLEGYIDAVIFVEGLKRASNPPTTESVINGLESIRDLDLGTGAPISFGPSEHQASHKVWGAVLGKDGQYRLIEQFK